MFFCFVLYVPTFEHGLVFFSFRKCTFFYKDQMVMCFSIKSELKVGFLNSGQNFLIPVKEFAS